MKTIHNILDELIEKKSTTLKQYSLQGYKQQVKKLKEEFADLYIKDITTEEIQDYVDDWSKKYSVNTIKVRIIILKEALKDNGIILNAIKIKNNKPTKKRIYDSDDIGKLENYFFKKIKSNHLTIPIAIYTGLRIGEILALQWLDIDLDRKLLSVSKNAEYIKEKGMILQDTKTKSSNREVAIPDQLCDILQKFMPQNNDDWDKYVVGNKEKPINVRAASRTAEIICARAGIEWKGFHAFRHSYATRMLECGIPAKAVSDLLGHSNITTTLNIYSHTTNDFKRDCVDKTFKNSNYEKEKEKEELNKQIYAMQEMLTNLIKKVEQL